MKKTTHRMISVSEVRKEIGEPAAVLLDTRARVFAA